jgi:hypothetical protein
MLHDKRKAVGSRWVALRVNGFVVKGKSTGGKVTRTRSDIIVLGDDEPSAMTDGIVKAEPTTIEFDMMNANTIMRAFGIVDGNVAVVVLRDQKFEMTESVRDPDTLPTNVGGWTSTGKGCAVESVEWKHEATEAPSAMTWVVKPLNWIIAAHDKGGGGFKV